MHHRYSSRLALSDLVARNLMYHRYQEIVPVNEAQTKNLLRDTWSLRERMASAVQRTPTISFNRGS